MLDRDNNFKLDRRVLCWLPRVSLGILVILGLIAVCPVGGDGGVVYAEEGIGASNYAALAAPTITLSMADSVNANQESKQNRKRAVANRLKT